MREKGKRLIAIILSCLLLLSNVKGKRTRELVAEIVLKYNVKKTEKLF